MPFCLFDADLNFLYGSLFGHDAGLLNLSIHAGVFHIFDGNAAILVQFGEALKLRLGLLEVSLGLHEFCAFLNLLQFEQLYFFFGLLALLCSPTCPASSSSTSEA